LLLRIGSRGDVLLDAGVGRLRLVLGYRQPEFILNHISPDSTAASADRYTRNRSTVRARGAMVKHRIFSTPFASVYPLYVQKAERKGRTQQEVDEVICWLTGYSPQTLAEQIAQKKDFETFFNEAPAPHPNAGTITGVVCGVRVEEIEDPLMRNIRRLDKLIDELAKGRPMQKILRGSSAGSHA
jgi:hypothetical protein